MNLLKRFYFYIKIYAKIAFKIFILFLNIFKIYKISTNLKID